MFKTEKITLQGKTKWHSITKINDYGKWTQAFYPNAVALETLRELQAEGVKNQIKKDDDGYYTYLSRPTSKEMKDKNGVKKLVRFDPPRVVDKDGQPMDNTPVGNGSDVTVLLEVYTHGTPNGGKAKAIRWEATRIDNLVPYERDSFPEEEQAGQALLSETKPETLF